MKKKLLLAVLILFVISVATALTVIDPGDLSSVDLIFEQAGSNSTYYFEIGRWSAVTNASINVSGWNISIDDTEDAWNNTPNVNNPERSVDENWTTYSTCAGGFGCAGYPNYIYENFTIPANAVGATWQVGYKHFNQVYEESHFFNNSDDTWVDLSIQEYEATDPWYNYSAIIPAEGLNETSLQLRTITHRDAFGMYGYYADGRVIWFINTSVLNTSIDIEQDGDNEFFISLLNDTSSPQLFNYANLTTSLRNYINITCSSSTCQIPTNITVASEGLIRLNAINITTRPSRFSSETYPGTTQETSVETFNVTVVFETGENLVVYLWYNGTNYLATQTDSETNNATYEYDLTIPLITSGASSVNRTFYWNITDSVETWYTSEHSHTVNAISLVNCTGAEMVTLNFSLYNEYIPHASITGDMEATFDIWIGGSNVLRQLNFSWTNQPYFEVCITPNTTSFQTTSFQEYSATGYSTRNYYLVNATLTNSTTNISLYLLNTGNSTTITPQVIDDTATGIYSVYGKIQRYFIGQNAYLTVAMIRTDSDGYAIVPLDTTGWYRWVFEQDGETVVITNPAQIIDTTPTFRITDAVSYLIRRYRTVQGLTYLLSFNNNTNITTFFFNDPSSMPVTGCLRMIREAAAGRTQLSYNCQHLSSATITHDLTGQEEAKYFGIASIIDDTGQEYILGEVEVDFESGVPIFGDEGVFWTAIVVGTSFMATVFNPIAGIVVAVISLSIMTFAGFIRISLGVIVGLAVTVGFIVYFSMRK